MHYFRLQRGLMSYAFLRYYLKAFQAFIKQKKVARENFVEPDKLDLPELKPIAPPAPKIAIYTCNIGDYDDVIPPLYLPENCDYYVVSDKNRTLEALIILLT